MAKTKPVRVLVDACCFLVYVTGQVKDVPAARQLLEHIQDGEIQLVESPAILTEVPPKHEGDNASRGGKRLMILGLLESEAVEYVDLTTAVARKAGDYMVSYGLDSMDAIHLATAVLGKVDVLVTLNTLDFPMDHSVEGVLVLSPEDFLRRFFARGSQPALDFEHNSAAD